eukprot:7387873-Prymnesium_polylepis.2
MVPPFIGATDVRQQGYCNVPGGRTHRPNSNCAMMELATPSPSGPDPGRAAHRPPLVEPTCAAPGRQVPAIVVAFRQKRRTTSAAAHPAELCTAQPRGV